eukprot:COSAG02_NODE_1259_length_13568_cov_747.342267_9_plen_92_part_00
MYAYKLVLPRAHEGIGASIPRGGAARGAVHYTPSPMARVTRARTDIPASVRRDCYGIALAGSLRHHGKTETSERLRPPCWCFRSHYALAFF